VAIKKIYPHLMQEQDLLDRFLQEATVVAQLNHPGLVTIHDLCEDADGIPAIVMERLQGKSLGAILADADSGRLESRRAVHLIAQAAEALDHAHRQGVVHRDINPTT
jgi:serine/threonine-protein kinase